MACATIKRQLEFLTSDTEMPTTSEAKRMRCASQASLTPPLLQHHRYNMQSKSRKQARMLRKSAAVSMGHRQEESTEDEDDENIAPCHPVQQMQGRECVFPSTNPEERRLFVQSAILDEVKRLRHRQQMSYQPGAAVTSDSNVEQNCNANLEFSTAYIQEDQSSCTSRDQPLFSLKQVELICDKQLREIEEKLRQEYSTILNQQLTDQYESFLIFTHEQLKNQFSNNSYSYIV